MLLDQLLVEEEEQAGKAAVFFFFCIDESDRDSIIRDEISIVPYVRGSFRTGISRRGSLLFPGGSSWESLFHVFRASLGVPVMQINGHL